MIALLALACSNAPSSPPVAAPEAPATKVPVEAPAVRTVDVAGLAAAREAGDVSLLIDVRTPGEFAGGHVPGAVNLPLSDLAGGLDAAVAGHEDHEIYVVCQSGRRSAKAADLMAARGLKAVNVAGGTAAWIAAGHPTE